MRSLERRLSIWLLFLGLALLVAVVVRVDAHEVLTLVSRAGGWLLVAIVLHMGSLACAAWAWRALVAYKVTPPGWRKSLAIYWVGDAFNALTPGDALGEVAKGALASRSIDGALTAASLITHRLLFAASGIATGVLASLLCLFHSRLPNEAVLALLGANLVAALPLIVVWYAIWRGATHRITRMFASAPFLSKRSRRRVLSAGRQLDDELAAGAKSGKRNGLQAVAWLAMMRVVQAVEIAVLLRSLVPDQSLWDVLLLGLLARSAAQLASWAAAWMPGQFGVLEGTQAVLFAALGLDPASGVALQLLMRARTFAFVAIGLGIGWREMRGSGLAEEEPVR